MFVGTFRHQLDSKGRVAVPAPFRRGLPEGSMVAIGADGRIVLYPPDEFGDLVERSRRSSSTAAEERALNRRLLGSARELELDAQGRMLVAPDHRTFAHIADRAVFTGVGNLVEVVGEAVWDEETSTFDAAAFTELHDRVNQAGRFAAPHES